MSTRADWGLFRPDGSRLEPLAVGDAWHKWDCPSRPWAHPAPEPHPFTGEMEPREPYPAQCPFKSVAVKRDECTRCGVVFIYP